MQFIVSHSETRAQSAAIERLVIADDQVAIRVRILSVRKMEATGSLPEWITLWPAWLYDARNAVCKYGAVERLSPRDGSSRWKFDQVSVHRRCTIGWRVFRDRCDLSFEKIGSKQHRIPIRNTVIQTFNINSFYVFFFYLLIAYWLIIYELCYGFSARLGQSISILYRILHSRNMQFTLYKFFSILWKLFLYNLQMFFTLLFFQNRTINRTDSVHCIKIHLIRLCLKSLRIIYLTQFLFHLFQLHN